jgi:hypothetical protein
MPDVRLELSDANELAELLTFLTEWTTGPDANTIEDTLLRFVGRTEYMLTTLHDDLNRFVFLLGASDGQDFFGEHQQ